MDNPRKQVALITIYDDFNIGNKLQNYALQEVISSEGFMVKTINTHSFGLWRLSWKGLAVMLLGIPREASHYRRMMLKRRHRFKEFSDQYLNVSPVLSYKKIASGALNPYDAIVCGSDQVWHHWTKKPEELAYFFLRFTEKKKRICYAPSFGFDDVAEEKKKFYCEGLKGFGRLSCREQSGCDLIYQLTGRKAERVCDPTMLLTPGQWDKIARKPESPVPEKYLLTYFLGSKSKQTENKIAEIAQEKNLSVVNVYCMEFCKENDQYFCTRPDEFIYLIRNASYVCTDSFHGTVFSILYHKDFLSFQRSGADGAMMHGRLQTLLELFHLEQYGDINHAGQHVDFEYADEVLKSERHRGIRYLHEELGNI